MAQQELITDTRQSSIVYLTKNFVNYNLWANTTLVNWLRTKPARLLEQEVPSSFPSVKLTLIHIWQTERYWLSILKKAEPQQHDASNQTLKEVFDNLLALSSELADHINAMVEENVQEDTLIVSPWFQSNFPNFEYIMHCVTHSTYHRGQVVTIGRNLGFTDAPMTDYNFYNINGK